MTLWQWVVVAGAAFWSDGASLESQIRARDYAVGTVAGVCQTYPAMCLEYVAQDVVIAMEPVQVKARMWVHSSGNLAAFDAADPRFGPGSWVETP